MITTISKGYQLTIPAEMRKKLGLSKGSKIELRLDEKNHCIKIEPISLMTFDELFAMADKIIAKKKLKPLTPAELDEEVEREMYGEFH